MYEIRCATCHLHGMASASREEVENLTTIHNGIVHHRAPVASVHRVYTFTRRRSQRRGHIPFVAGEAIERPPTEHVA